MAVEGQSLLVVPAIERAKSKKVLWTALPVEQ
jgi:hypothetical protein